jgi:hypothetical protein
MKRASVVGRLGVLAGLAWANGATAQAPEPVRYEAPGAVVRAGATAPVRARRPDPPPLDAVPPGWREKVARVVQQPTLAAHGPAEEFRASVYDWLLDHPDRVALAWRRLGVPCVPITDRGQGRFGWVDGQGSDITWLTVSCGPGHRIWYAEGKARPGSLLPVMPVKAVAVLRYAQRIDDAGRLFIAHEVDVYLQTDSKAAALVTKLIGPAAPRLAEQGAAQLLLFFSAMAGHLEQHPEQMPALLRGAER